MRWRKQAKAEPTTAQRIEQARVAHDRIEGHVADLHRRRVERIRAEQADNTRLHVCPVWGCDHQVVHHIYRPGRCAEHNEYLIDTGVRANELEGAR